MTMFRVPNHPVTLEQLAILLPSLADHYNVASTLDISLIRYSKNAKIILGGHRITSQKNLEYRLRFEDNMGCKNLHAYRKLAWLASMLQKPTNKSLFNSTKKWQVRSEASMYVSMDDGFAYIFHVQGRAFVSKDDRFAYILSMGNSVVAHGWHISLINPKCWFQIWLTTPIDVSIPQSVGYKESQVFSLTPNIKEIAFKKT